MSYDQISADAPRADHSEAPGMGLKEFIDENRDDLEVLAAKEYPISRVIQQLLDRRDRGEF